MKGDEDEVTRRPIRRDWPSGPDIVAPCAGFISSAAFFEWLACHLEVEGHLTQTECSICELLLLGRSYVDISIARDISVETVKWHVKRILRKLGISSTRELLWVIGYRIDVLGDE